MPEVCEFCHQKTDKLMPEVCEFCHQKTDKYEVTKLILSNIRNHIYTDNQDDYQWVHHSCHQKFDFENFKK